MDHRIRREAPPADEAAAALSAPYRFGPLVGEERTLFRLWAPAVPGVELILPDTAPLSMRRLPGGWFERLVDGIAPGQRYRFRAGRVEFPDPASRAQADDVDGWSLTLKLPRRAASPVVRPWHEAVIAELHVGAATPEGSFAGLAHRLGHFAKAGYTALELMPIGDFPGDHNWGYDGVLPFAPEANYGSPAELRALVDAAHGHGLAMILDVVYNHFGPVGNFLPHYAPAFFSPSADTPWGAGPDFTNPLVRRFFLENVRLWLEDYDFDGLRFDAVHAYGTRGAPLFKAELAAAARAIKPDALLILENLAYEAEWLERNESGRPRHFDAQWHDDIHHALHVLTTEQTGGYYGSFAEEPVARASAALADGLASLDAAAPLPPTAFVSFIQNHDQIGNQPQGKRLAEALDADRLDFLHFVIMLSPQIPMFFMGEEAHLRTPFPFFGDLRGELADSIREGRAKQALEFSAADAEPPESPDPIAPETMAMASLPWAEFELPERQRALARFRELIGLRRRHIWSLAGHTYRGAGLTRSGACFAVRWRYDGVTLAMALNPRPTPGEIGVDVGEPLATTGRIHRTDGRLALGPWSALLWMEQDGRTTQQAGSAGE